ncbi:Transposase IS4 [Popillia japonica]|uniref:Transposase IS4 n=1 Tax=Popillia japonica TaxID=7064 RepID=A0AAW1MA00_POPJA
MSRNRWEQINSKIHFNDNNLLVGTRIAETMSRNRWEQINSKIHFNDNNLLVGCKDKLYKIRSFIDSIVKNFNKIPIREKICVDGQMIPYKGHHSIKQYMKAKPKQ